MKTEGRMQMFAIRPVTKAIFHLSSQLYGVLTDTRLPMMSIGYRLISAGVLWCVSASLMV